MKHRFRMMKIFAVLALLMNISIHLMPALAALSGQMQITICSAYDTRIIAIDQNGNEIPQPSEKSKKACAFCITANTSITLPETIQITALLPLPIQTIKKQNQTLQNHTYINPNTPSHAPPTIFKA